MARRNKKIAHGRLVSRVREQSSFAPADPEVLSTNLNNTSQFSALDSAVMETVSTLAGERFRVSETDPSKGLGWKFLLALVAGSLFLVWQIWSDTTPAKLSAPGIKHAPVAPVTDFVQEHIVALPRRGEFLGSRSGVSLAPSRTELKQLPRTTVEIAIPDDVPALTRLLSDAPEGDIRWLEARGINFKSLKIDFHDFRLMSSQDKAMASLFKNTENSNHAKLLSALSRTNLELKLEGAQRTVLKYLDTDGSPAGVLEEVFGMSRKEAVQAIKNYGSKEEAFLAQFRELSFLERLEMSQKMYAKALPRYESVRFEPDLDILRSVDDLPSIRTGPKGVSAVSIPKASLPRIPGSKIPIPKAPIPKIPRIRIPL